MSWKTESKMVLLHVNHLMTKAHTWSNGSSLTYVTGFGTEMLDDDDATTQLKTATVSGTPELRVDFGSNTIIKAFGICNHTLKSANVDQLRLSSSANGSTWSFIDSTPYTLPVPFPLAAATIDPNRDIALIFDNVNNRHFRVEFLSGGAITNFNIGYIYWGDYWPFNKNVLDGGFIQSRRSSTRYIQSAGGMSHAIKSMTYRPATLELNFGRAHPFDMTIFSGYAKTDYIVGVIPPEQVTAPTQAPYGQDIFYGRFDSIDQAPMTPSNIAAGNEAYNATVTMVGAV